MTKSRDRRFKLRGSFKPPPVTNTNPETDIRFTKHLTEINKSIDTVSKRSISKKYPKEGDKKANGIQIQQIDGIQQIEGLDEIEYHSDSTSSGELVGHFSMDLKDEGGLVDTSLWDYTYTDETILGSISDRLALTGLDWDQLTVKDIYTMIYSRLAMTRTSPSKDLKNSIEIEKEKVIDATEWVPNVDHLLRVEIYMSEFGKERVFEENRNGPMLYSKSKENRMKLSGNQNEDVNEDVSSSLFETKIRTEENDVAESLRRYKKERTNYYYAIAIFSDPMAADLIYKDIDGVAVDFCSFVLNVSFVPKDLVLPLHSEDVCDSLPINYTLELQSGTGAFLHTHTQCNWDLPDARRKVLHRKTTNLDLRNIDLKAYVASSSSSDEDPMETRKSLLGEMDDSDDVNSMDGNINTKEKQKVDKDITTEQVVNCNKNIITNINNETKEDGDWDHSMVVRTTSLKTKVKDVNKVDDINMTPWQKYLRDRKKRKKEKQRIRTESTAEILEGRENERNMGYGDSWFQKDSLEETKDFKTIKHLKTKKLNGNLGDGNCVEINDSRLMCFVDDPEFAIDQTDDRFNRKDHENLMKQQSHEKRRKRLKLSM